MSIQVARRDPFQLIVESAPSALVMVNADRTVVLVNRKAEELFGYGREELVGQPVEVLVPSRFRAMHAQDAHRFFAQPQARAMGAGRDLFGLRKDGAEIPIEIGLTPIETPDGLATLASIIDITERKRAEAEIERATRELERSNRELDDFAFVASHDLRAPLRDIDNLAQWIAEDVAGALPEPTMRHLELMRGRIRRMEALLEDLLEYSRAGRIFGAPEPVDIRALLVDVCEMVGRPETFDIVLPDRSVAVETPKPPLEQVLRNLIGNAIKHHDRADGTVRVEIDDAGDFVEFTVADDGPGIPVDLHERAFGMFQTLRPRDEVEGTGMGLALVKRLVQAYGGEIRLDSDRGRGAAFHFTWPRAWAPGGTDG